MNAVGGCEEQRIMALRITAAENAATLVCGPQHREDRLADGVHEIRRPRHFHPVPAPVAKTAEVETFASVVQLDEWHGPIVPITGEEALGHGA
jgi:hypothetical protein